MRTLILAMVGGFLLASELNAAVNVYINTSAPPTLQADFIAAVTSQYNATVVKSPYFANTYSITINSKKVPSPCTGTAPCNLDKNVALMVANSTKTYEYGFANGMDEERLQNVYEIHYLQGVDYAKKTCGGVPLAPTSTVSVSTGTCHNACLNAYNVIVSTINQRWGYVFDATGKIVSP